MSKPVTSKRSAASLLLAALSLMLTGCLITPGKFDSTLTLNQDNSFSFSYNGELFFLALSPSAFGSGSDAQFESSECYDSDYEERDCTPEEVAEQQAEWDTEQARKKEKDAEEAKKMSALMGGIDPNDPEAGNKFAEMLERQRGWDSVQYVGEGLFNVRYSASGQLSHDLTFPVIEGVPMPNPFIQVILRDDNVVRVNAPGFAAQEGGGPMAGMMMGGFSQGMNEAMAEESEDGKTGIPEMRGTFRVVTNGRILANNTDEGPAATATGETLQWYISPTTSSAPTALVKLGRQ